MSLSAYIQITDQDIYQQSSTKGAAMIGQVAVTSSDRMFAYALAGGTLTGGQITEPLAVTANYATRTLGVAAAINTNQITVTLGTTAAADLFIGYWFVVTDGVGAGQGAYYITGNTAATAANSYVTVVSIKGTLTTALDTTSVVGIYPNQETTVIQHTAVSAMPTAGAPVIGVTSGYYFWNQVTGYASILSDASVATKNTQAIPSAGTLGAVTIDVNTDLIQTVGYAPELMVSGKYSPLILTIK